jgi:hypothetical protein
MHYNRLRSCVCNLCWVYQDSLINSGINCILAALLAAVGFHRLLLYILIRKITQSSGVGWGGGSRGSSTAARSLVWDFTVYPTVQACRLPDFFGTDCAEGGDDKGLGSRLRAAELETARSTEHGTATATALWNPRGTICFVMRFR